MSKVIPATCEAGVVTALEHEVPTAVIHSEGVAASDGLLLVDGDRADYVAKITPDLKTTLTKIAASLGHIASALSALDGAGFLVGATGAVPGLPVATGSISSLNTLKAELETLKDNLK